MKIKLLFLIAFAGTLLVATAYADETTSIKVKPGVYYIKFFSLDSGKTPQDIFGTDIYRNDDWRESIRLLTAETSEVLGCHLKTTPEWNGTLEKINNEQSYWLVIPYGAGEFELPVNCKKVEAGYAYQLSGGITVGYSNGKTITAATSTPQSSATYKTVDKKVKNMSASSSVHVQQQSQGFSKGMGSSLSPSSMLVKIPIDTVYGLYGGEVWYPITHSSSISVPQPMDFNKRPW